MVVCPILACWFVIRATPTHFWTFSGQGSLTSEMFVQRFSLHASCMFYFVAASRCQDGEGGLQSLSLRQVSSHGWNRCVRNAV